MNYIEFIERGLDIEINSNLEKGCRGLSIDKVIEFSTVYLAVKDKSEHTFVTSKKDKSFYMPLFDENFLRSMPAHMRPTLLDLDNPYTLTNLSSTSDLMYSLLVFSDEVIIKDPLPYYLTYFYGQKGDYRQEKAIKDLTSLLKWLRAIRPLYDAGKISFYNGMLALEKRFKSGNSIGRYHFKGENNEETMWVNSYLDKIDEMHGLSEDLNADIYLNTKYSLKAYEYWMSGRDKVVRKSEIERFNTINTFLNFDFPLYSCGSENEFLDIIDNEDSAKFLREFLAKSFSEIVNIDDITKKAVLNEISTMAKEKISCLEKQMSSLTSIS